eukprot:6197508-Pleurochrysis_carterae.AAC.9
MSHCVSHSPPPLLPAPSAGVCVRVCVLGRASEKPCSKSTRACTCDLDVRSRSRVVGEALYRRQRCEVCVREREEERGGTRGVCVCVGWKEVYGKEWVCWAADWRGARVRRWRRQRLAPP